MSLKPEEKILVVGPSWVGDMVMSQALYTYLRATRPGVVIDVLAPAWSGAVIARMPEVQTLISSAIGHGELALKRRWQLGRQLAAENYQQAIVLPNSFKSAIVPLLAGIPRRTGWQGEARYGLLNDRRKLDPVAYPLMVERYVSLGLDSGEPLPAEFPVPNLAVDEADMASGRSRFELGSQPLLALCPGAEFGAAKCWPPEYYTSVAEHYLARGWQVVLLGSANDRPVTAPIAQSLDHTHCHDLAGATRLADAVDLLATAGAVVSNDSGLMHIASALHRPLVAIYGATSPGFTPPLGRGAKTVVSQIDCAPCFERECPFGHHRCMRETMPQQVIDTLDTLLEDYGCGY